MADPPIATTESPPEPEPAVASPEKVDAAAATPATLESEADLGGTRATRGSKPVPAALEDSDEEDGSSDEEGEFPVAELGPDGLPSVGSAGHAQGECKRCCFYPKGRCTNGHDCRFCHLEHEKRKRLKKKKRRSENPTPTSMPGSLVGGVSLSSGIFAPGGLGLTATTPLATTPLGGSLLPGMETFMQVPMAMPPGGLPPMPFSPSAPPPGPPLLKGLELDTASAETPPPPSEAPTVPAGGGDDVEVAPEPPPGEAPAPSTETTEAAADGAEPLLATTPSKATGGGDGETADADRAADITTSPTGTDAGLAGKPVTLTDLLTGASPKGAAAGENSASKKARDRNSLSVSTEELPLWQPPALTSPTGAMVPPVDGGLVGPMGYWSPYLTAASAGWPYPGYPATAATRPGAVGSTTAVAGSPIAAAPYGNPLLPPIQPGVPGYPSMVPPLMSPLGAAGQPATPVGLERDSPRSAVLTLCGAWGALTLKAPGEAPEGANPDAAQLSRSALLAYRRVSKGEKRPGALKSLKVRAHRAK